MVKNLQKKYLTYYNLLIPVYGKVYGKLSNLSKEIHKIKSKYGNDNRKDETFRIKYKYYDCFLEYTSFKDDLRE